MMQFVRPSRASIISRIKTLTGVYLRHLIHRPLYIVAMVLSFALVMAAVTLTFSVREGLRATLDASTEAGLYFMMNAQTNSELLSQISLSQALYVKRLEAGDAQPYSPELALLTRQTPDREQKEFILRGVLSDAFSLINPVNGQLYVRLDEGRMFSPGSNEVIVGSAIQKHYPAYRIGGTVTVRGQPWKIVGVFSSNGSVRESEFWADWDHLRTDYGLGPVYSVVVFGGRKDRSDHYNAELMLLDKDKVTVRDSLGHYAGQGQDLMDLMLYFGLVFSILAGGVAISGVAALVESLLLNQAQELRVLQLIGYGRERFVACIVQIALLGAAGGIVGMAVCVFFFSGTTFTTFAESRELTFSITTNGTVISIAVVYCAVLGCIAGALVVPRLSRSSRRE